MLRAYSGYVPWAAGGQIGIEIQDLIHPDAATPAMPDPIGGLEDFWAQALLGSSLPISFHGPATSEPLYDAERRESALAHLRRAMDAAAGLSARYFIVHPELRFPPAEKGGVAGALSVWETVLHEAKARNLILLLENTNEEGPDRLRSLTAAIESPALGLCLDVGHAHRHSRIPLEDWVSAFGNDLLYVHLYNIGETGLHRALDDGDIPIERFLDLLAKSRPGVNVCLEMDLGRIIESMKWLEGKVGNGKGEGGS
jgi:sugar phosphate isomerase/epimerase